MAQLQVTASVSVPVADRWRRLTRPLLVGAGTLAASAYLFRVDPNQAGHYPLCPTYALAGVYCPGCGMLRATHDLLHLDVAGALARNPIAPLVLGGMLALWLTWVWSRWTGARVTWTPARWMPYAIGGFVLAFTIARNIPGWTLLSPA